MRLMSALRHSGPFSGAFRGSLAPWARTLRKQEAAPQQVHLQNETLGSCLMAHFNYPKLCTMDGLCIKRNAYGSYHSVYHSTDVFRNDSGASRAVSFMNHSAATDLPFTGHTRHVSFRVLYKAAVPPSFQDSIAYCITH